VASIKVAIVDDSAFMRKIISDSLNSHSHIEVIAKFRNGKDLVEQFDRYKPDIITLDVEMPVMNGLETLKVLKNSNINCPVIMLSSLTSENSIYTLECLELGATDFVEKPSVNLAIDSKFNKVLVDKVLTIAEQGKKNIYGGKLTNSVVPISRDNRNPIKAVVVGASTGGPKALQKVLTEIKQDIGVPIFVVQHMPKGFTKAFADRLNGICKLRTIEASNGMPIENNIIYIAQGGYHMTVGKDNKIWLNEEPAIWGVRPAVDKLFESAVKVYGGSLLSVVLTGMGRDGASCTIYGMPKATYETGKVDMVLQLQVIADKINSLVKGR
jgi:two-component system chemotaxis response regulator CheB